MPASDLTPATGHDHVPPVRNGVYAISDQHSAFTFKIHTLTQARSADLVGKRVVSRLMPNGGYQAFGFLTTSGELRIWARFADEEDKPWVRFAKSLLRHCVEALAYMDYRELSIGQYSRRGGTTVYLIEWQFLCRVCNGGLRTDDDVLGGVHFNGVCTTELSPRQRRDEAARRQRETEEQRVREAQERAIEEARELRRSGSGVFPDVPDAIVARLPRSQIDARVLQ